MLKNKNVFFLRIENRKYIYMYCILLVYQRCLYTQRSHFPIDVEANGGVPFVSNRKTNRKMINTI